ncbi:hypothetical protein L2E82_09125 [Cichorium intybus]|uniref:Uncharacterized protein n=1 Tax=Cichorium intybus TaxID=13427 RepID=A0ACB9G7H0_CICIN|nr:hypothetical protein L2E82_09125 [Cichorium intybus]
MFDSNPMDLDNQSPIQEVVYESVVEEAMVPTTELKAGGSSSNPPPVDTSKGKNIMFESEFVDVVSLQNLVFELEQKSTKKDLLISNLDIRVTNLEKENAAKDKKIFQLEANFGGVSALFFDLKQRLTEKFGVDFFAHEAEENRAAAASGSRHAATSGSRPFTPGSSVNIDEYLSLGPHIAEDKREQQRQRELQKEKRGDTLERFSDKYGDCSGITFWGCDGDKKVWWVKINTDRVEYYDKPDKFTSWITVDLTELSYAPFHNPSQDQEAWKFFRFLEIQPATDKLKATPIGKPLPDGSLHNMEFWAFDPTSHTAVIKLGDNQIRLIEHKDLQMFGERDIKKLACIQIVCEIPLFEATAKPFTGTAIRIAEKGYWAGALARADMNLLDLEL